MALMGAGNLSQQSFVVNSESIGGLLIDLGLNTARFYQQLTGAEAQAKATGASMGRHMGGQMSKTMTGTAMRMGDDLRRIGKLMFLKFSLPLLAIGGLAVKTAIDTEYAWKGVQKVYDGSAKEIESKLMPAADKLAVKFGQSKVEVIGVFESLAAMGYTGSKLIDMVTNSMEFATAGTMDLEQAQTAVVAVSKVFGYEGEKLRAKLAALNTIENASAATMKDLSTAVTVVGNSAKESGVSIEELGAMMAVLRERGVPAAQAANSLKSIFTSIFKETKNATKIWKDYGVEVYTSTGKAKDADLVLQEMAKTWNKLSDEQKNVILQEQIGKYQRDKFLALMNELGKKNNKYNQVLKKTADETKNLATYQRELNTFLSSSKVKMGQAREALKLAGEEIGRILLPMVLKAAIKVKELADAFAKMPIGKQRRIVDIIFKIAVIAPMLMIAGATISALSVIGTLLASPVGAVAITIALYFASLTALRYFNDNLIVAKQRLLGVSEGAQEANDKFGWLAWSILKILKFQSYMPGMGFLKPIVKELEETQKKINAIVNTSTPSGSKGTQMMKDFGDALAAGAPYLVGQWVDVRDKLVEATETGNKQMIATARKGFVNFAAQAFKDMSGGKMGIKEATQRAQQLLNVFESYSKRMGKAGSQGTKAYLEKSLAQFDIQKKRVPKMANDMFAAIQRAGGAKKLNWRGVRDVVFEILKGHKIAPPLAKKMANAIANGFDAGRYRMKVSGKQGIQNYIMGAKEFSHIGEAQLRKVANGMVDVMDVAKKYGEKGKKGVWQYAYQIARGKGLGEKNARAVANGVVANIDWTKMGGRKGAAGGKAHRDALKKKQSLNEKAAEEVRDGTVNKMESGGKGGKMYKKGLGAMDALILGMKAAGVVASAGALAGDIIKEIAKVFGIKSPSSIMRDVGRNLMLGLGQGIGLKSGNVMDVLKAVGTDAIGLAMSLFGGGKLGELVSGLGYNAGDFAMKMFAKLGLSGGGGGSNASFNGLAPWLLNAFNMIQSAIPGNQVLTSGFRPGSRVRGSGRRSLHASGLAIDIGGANLDAVARYAGAFIGLPGFSGGVGKTGLGEILWRTMVGGNHFDHVHLGMKKATSSFGGMFHKGGWVGGMGDVPIMAQAGELVVPKTVARFFRKQGISTVPKIKPAGTQVNFRGMKIEIVNLKENLYRIVDAEIGSNNEQLAERAEWYG